MNTIVKIFTLATTAGILASCSSTNDLASLNEYDDLYYQANDHAAYAPAQHEFSSADNADAAEAAYYGNDGYNEGPSDATPTEDTSASKSTSYDEDYYDPDYARRIENFSRNNSSNYVYNQAYNSGPRFGMSLGYGFGTYSPYSSWNIGFSYGYPSLYSPFYYDPWGFRYDPWRRPWFGPRYFSYYDPWSPWYPYGPYGYYPSYGYGGYGYGGYPYYGGGYPYYGGTADYDYGSNSTYGRRQTSSRNSRGGVVRTGDRSSTMTEGPKSTLQQDGKTTPTRERATRSRDNADTRSDYYNPNERDRILRDTRGTETERPRNTRVEDRDTRAPDRVRTPRQPAQPLTSPYTRQRNRGSDAPSYDNAPTRRQATPRNAPSRNYNTPSRNRYSPPSGGGSERSAPAARPSRNSGGGNSGSGSPSRSRDTRHR